MVGPRYPYPGENGVIREGALADLLLVDGNPFEDLDLIADPQRNFLWIMEDGVIYKSIIPEYPLRLTRLLTDEVESQVKCKCCKAIGEPCSAQARRFFSWGHPSVRS